MPPINWIRCADQMPRQNVVAIIRDSEHTNYSSVLSGSEIKQLGWDANDEWCVYTAEVWEELNK